MVKDRENANANGGEAPIPPEVARAMCDWRPYTEDLDLHGLPKPITYLITAAGVRVARKTPVGVVVEELRGEPLIPIPLKPLETGLRLGIPRVPWECLRTVVAFFRAVAKQHQAEALVRIYRHKTSGAWEMKVPAQDVSGGSVRVDDRWTFDDAGAYTHVMDIHSHVDMNPFFSGTDDEDERRAVRLYGVIGKISQPMPQSSWRIWTGFEFLNLAITDVIEIPATAFSVRKELKELLMLEDRKVTMDFSHLDPFSGATFPEEWMKALETDTRWRGVKVFRNGKWEDDEENWYGGGWRGWPARQEALPLGGRLQRIADAKDFAIANTDKLVYVVLGDKVSRIEANGEVRPTGMTLGALRAMQDRAKKGTGREIVTFDVTPPMLGGRGIS